MFRLHAYIRAGVLATAMTGGALTANAQTAAAPAALDFFETKIRPILATRCYECHGPEEQKSDLRVDHIDFLMTGGERGSALVIGDPEASRLIQAVEYLDPAFQMPPKAMLQDEEIDLLIDWIEMGAPWPDEPVPGDYTPREEFDLEKRRDTHWAWQPLRHPQPPTVHDEEAAPTDVDRFVVAALEDAGLEPGPETDKRTLIRRLYFDLIGLPPTPDQIAAFLKDDSPDAIAKIVDGLLASPHYGERWGRHWLDLMRYAETYGHEQDYPIREAWKYRDYVIRALNADVPYDQFTREHIAGDLLADPRIHPEEGYNESIIGTGWWYMHQATHAPVDVLKDEADRIDNQVDVMSKTFLGMTVSCARCHDHKFDAISAEDYYSLTAFLRASRQEFAYLDPKDRIRERRERAKATHAAGRADIARAVGATVQDVAAQVEIYLLAAREVTHGASRPEESNAYVEKLLADFEDGTYGAWTAEGAAFGDAPAAGTLENQNPVSGFEGRFLVNSFLKGDAPKGKLTSPEFTIDQPYIRFLVGGGRDAKRTGVNLLVDGNIVRTAAGRNSEHLLPHRWDVRAYIGKTARIEIVDDASGGWGHINADHFVLTENPVIGSTARPARMVARERNLDEDRLAAWVNLLRAPETDTADHPLHAWRMLAGLDGAALEEARQQLTSDAPPADSVLYEDFDDGYGGWFVRGHAFEGGPTQAAAWEPLNAGGQLAPAGVAHSGLLGAEWQGMIRSPTFIMEHDSIHYRMKGSRGRIRLIIGRYELRDFNGILFENTHVNVNTGDEYVWHHQIGGLGKFKGAHAYIEIIDDSPNGYVAVDEIRFSNSPPANPGVPRGLASRLSGGGPANAARAYADWTRAALDSWNAAGLNRDDATWVNLLMREGLVDAAPLRAAFETESAKLADAVKDLPEPMRVLAIDEGTIEPAHVFIRGNHTEPGKPVQRRWLAALNGDETFKVERGSGRLELAEAVIAEDNPLFPRVIVNRVWHHLFGVGIVPSVDDFGVLGRTPSHPELLDYLATEFREDGYSLKRLIRKLALTRAYRLSSKPTSPAAEEKDPANVLLHRANVRRLQGEIIRDSLLAVSGHLDPTLYGPPIRTYLSPFMTYHRRDFQSGPMDGDGRRTIYLEVRRNFLPDLQLAFDFPLPDSTIGSRTVSNLPAQSLILMNDPFVAEQAKRLGAEIAAGNGSVRDRIASVHERVLGRLPDSDELARLEGFVKDQGSLYMLSTRDAARDERVWADLCQVLFMTNEFIFIG